MSEVQCESGIVRGSGGFVGFAGEQGIEASQAPDVAEPSPNKHSNPCGQKILLEGNRRTPGVPGLHEGNPRGDGPMQLSQCVENIANCYREIIF